MVAGSGIGPEDIAEAGRSLARGRTGGRSRCTEPHTAGGGPIAAYGDCCTSSRRLRRRGYGAR